MIKSVHTCMPVHVGSTFKYLTEISEHCNVNCSPVIHNMVLTLPLIFLYLFTHIR